MREKIHIVFKNILDFINDVEFCGEGVKKKLDNSLVTPLDIIIQNRIVDIIQNEFHQHNILFEEGEMKYINKGGEYTWVIDPIDGTSNMVNGKDEYSVSVGLMENDKFIAAQVTFPALKENYLNVLDNNVYLNGKQYNSSVVSDTCMDVILCSKSLKLLKPYCESDGYNVSFYFCATYSILKLIKGEALMYFTKNTNLYDVGPMSFIASKFGIKVMNINLQQLIYKPKIEIIPFFMAINPELEQSQRALSCWKKYINNLLVFN